MPETECTVCGKLHKCKRSRIAKYKNHYCSKECLSVGLKRTAASKPYASYCGYCGKGLHRKPSINSKQRFCNDECYRKTREYTHSDCLICGKDFVVRGKNQKTCSYKCGRKWLSLRKSSYVKCSYCGTSVKKDNSKLLANNDSYCNQECRKNHSFLANSHNWKGGFFKRPYGTIFILVGTYINTDKNGNKMLRYKNRAIVEAELFLGYELKDRRTAIHIEGKSSNLDSIYICSGHSEFMKITKGSQPYPNRTNLDLIAAHRLHKEDKLAYNRLPDHLLNEFITNSYLKH